MKPFNVDYILLAKAFSIQHHTHTQVHFTWRCLSMWTVMCSIHKQHYSSFTNGVFYTVVFYNTWKQCVQYLQSQPVWIEFPLALWWKLVIVHTHTILHRPRDQTAAKGITGFSQTQSRGTTSGLTAFTPTLEVAGRFFYFWCWPRPNLRRYCLLSVLSLMGFKPIIEHSQSFTPQHMWTQEWKSQGVKNLAQKTLYT